MWLCMFVRACTRSGECSRVCVCGRVINVSLQVCEFACICQGLCVVCMTV